MKNKFKSYKFWVGLIASVVVLITTLGTFLNFGVDKIALTSIGATVLGVLVAFGVVSKENSSTSIDEDINSEINAKNDDKEKTTNEILEKADKDKK